jgi:hypothetical protein
VAATTLEELQIKFTAQMGGLTSQLNGVKKQLGGVETSVKSTSTAFAGLARAAKLFIGAYVIRGMIKLGKESLSMANDVVESESLFAVSMKGMAASARAWSEELSASLGLNAYNLRKNVGTFNTMFMSMGLGEQAAYNMSTSLVQLAEDMASFYNVDPEEMFTKLRAGITGETEPLKRLGIMVDENTIKQYALSEGISTTGKNLTQTGKLMARYAAIMAQTTNAQGDLARTINSPVNQIRLLNNTLDMAKIALGQAFQPIQAIVLPILNSLARAALTAANAVKNFMWALTGFTGISSGAADIAGEGADANGKLADSLNDTSKALKNAGGAAKKAAKDAKIGLKAFDEINKLADESEKANSGSGGLGEMPEVVQNEKYADALESVNAAMSKAADWLKKVWEVALPTIEALSRLWETIKDFATTVVWGSLVDFYEKFLKPIGEWTITKALPEFLDAVSAGIKTLKTMWEESRPAWEKFYQTVLKPLGEWVGDRIIDALRWLKQAFDDISKWVKDNPETFGKIVDGILSIGGAIVVVWGISKLISAVQTAFSLLETAVSLFTSPKGAITLLIAALIWCAMNWDKVKETAVAVWNKIKETWAVVSQWFYDNVTKPLADWFKQAWEDIKGFFSGAWATITVLWSTVSTWFNTNVVEPVVGWFKQAWEDIKGFFTGAYDAVTSAWEGLATWFDENIIGPIRDAWNSLMEFLGVKKTVEVEYKVTTVQNTVFTSTKGNEYGGRGGSLSEATKTAIPGLFGVLPFAKGGVFQPNKPFVGLLGDQKNGRNIEAPENLIRQIFRDEMFSNPTVSLAGMPTSSFGGMSSDITSNAIESGIERGIQRVMSALNLTLAVDGEQFGRVAVRTINDTQRAAGRLLLEM